MSWASAKRKAPQAVEESSYFQRPDIPQHKVDWARLVSIDFETFYSVDYTLKKMSTSEYVRDKRFKAQMMGIKVGNGKTKIIPAARIKAELAKINWATHSVLCHNTQFDGFILSHHYGVHPVFLYDSLAMARGLHSNDIGAGLDEVSIFYGGQGKTEGGLDGTQGVLNWDKPLYDKVAVYCANDVDEMFRIFCAMLPQMPDDEIRLIDMITRMFTSPVLKVDIPRVEKELERELEKREKLMYAAVEPSRYDVGGDLYERSEWMKMFKKVEREYEGVERDMHIIKKIIGSGEKFANLLRDEGVEVPRKISPSWMKLSKEEREDRIEDKYSYAFAKDDADFINLPNDIESWGFDLENPDDVQKMAVKQTRLQALVDVRIAVKSTTNITRAERFLEAGREGMSLPVGYAYYRAHTGRLGGNNKMNMQNLQRGGELRLSILAPKGHVIAVQDSGQIEARVNGWLWGQDDLLDAFRAADNKTGKDAYCNFADSIYGRPITKADENERFVGKVCIAEGELVLTDRGLVPINLISKEDRLWDGVEWVTHEGLIDQGIKEVITYDGLTATPDHEVFTEDGRIIPLGQAASEMVRLQRTGIEGQAIWFCDDHVVADTPRKRLSVRQGQVLAQRGHQADSTVEPRTGKDYFVSQKWSEANPPRRSVGATIRRYLGSVYQSIAEVLEQLWRPRYSAPVLVTDGIYPVGGQEPAPRELCASGDRPDSQRRTLCAREFEAGYTNSTESKQAQHTYDFLARCVGIDPRVRQPLEPDVHVQTIEDGLNGRANTRKVRTFDIANAGPRRRYTVSGKLCLNCVLGLGYQMGAPKLQITLAKGALGGPPVFFPLTQCQFIVNTYRSKNHRISNGWNICKRIIEDMAAGREGSHGPISWEQDMIWLPNGMCLKYPDLKKSTDENGWDAWTYHSTLKGVPIRKKIYGGLLCENIVQALARIIVMWQMLQIGKRYRCVMTTHDEIAALATTRGAKTCADFMLKWMKTPPPWCQDLPLNSEGKVAVNYSK